RCGAQTTGRRGGVLSGAEGGAAPAHEVTMNALFLLLLLTAQQPDDVTRRIGEATLLIDSGKVDQAIAALQPIGAEHPDNETPTYELGLAYSAKGDAENCRKILEPLADTAR